MAKMNEEGEKEKQNPTRTVTWSKSFDYVLSLLGMMIGLGNVWRFPYLCYKHGGGAFLIAYWIYVFAMIFPLIVLESALGQFTGHSPVKAWGLVPIFKGIGYAVPFLIFYCDTYYAVLLAWALRWFTASFSSDMPWTTCENEWNTNSCLPLFPETRQNNMTVGNDTGFAKNLTMNIPSNSTQTSVEEFWRIHILGLTSGIEDLGGVKMDIFLCFTIIWIGTYFCVWKGISWTSKMKNQSEGGGLQNHEYLNLLREIWAEVVYVTATLPLVMLIIVTVRGVTLQGADEGLKKYLQPNVSSLGEVELWTDAASQVLYSLGACTGGLPSLSAYNKFNHNFFRDAIILVVLNAGASFVSGLAIFSVLGFLADAKNTTIDAVAESGPGLVFMVYPTALSLLPLPQFWCALFFLTLIFLGYDSMFVFQEALVACIRDKFSFLFQRKYSGEVVSAVVCFVMFLFGIPMTTRGGMYVLNIFNFYSVSGWCLYFISLSEFVAIGWVYGADRMLDNMKRMLGFDVPRWWMKICWKFIAPAIGTVLMILSLAAYQPLKYDRGYSYPVWADSLGWFTALNSILCIPITAIYIVWKAKGNSIAEKFRFSTTPEVFHKEGVELNDELDAEKLCRRENDSV